MKKGEQLERIIISINEYYRRKDIAWIEKIPTPTKYIKSLTRYIKEKLNSITKKDLNRLDRNNSYFVGTYDQKSTVDFIGSYKGKMLCFDCKMTDSKDGLSKSLLKEHQMYFLNWHHKQGCPSFLLIYLTAKGDFVLLSVDDEVYNRYNTKGKGFSYSYLIEKGVLISSNGAMPCDYIEAVRKKYGY